MVTVWTLDLYPLSWVADVCLPARVHGDGIEYNSNDCIRISSKQLNNSIATCVIMCKDSYT